jgi:hypothetical protein
VTDPRTAPEIVQALRTLHAESVSYWTGFDTPTFLGPMGSAWSPADNVRHLTKSMRAVSVGLRVPRLVLWFRGRNASGVSRGYTEMRDTYLAHLAKGVTAGKFAPSPRPVPADPEAERATIMRYHATAVDELTRLAGKWPERSLDRLTFPHPLMGPISVREMLHFTLYHNRHHVNVVRRRLNQGDLGE